LDSGEEIPLIDVAGASYEIVDETTINIFWEDPLPSRYINGYFDDIVSFYARLSDEFGNVVDNDNLELSLLTNVSYTYDNDVTRDIFLDEQFLSAPQEDDLYKYAVEKFTNGVCKGTISLTDNKDVLKYKTKFESLHYRHHTKIRICFLSFIY
jgi:hypothetical protein